MGAESGRPRRIMLAVTATSPLRPLWGAVAEHLADEEGEFVMVFVTDEQWPRAASLPFTREISRFSGTGADFTPQRAAQLDREVIGRTQREIERLAAERQLRPVFETLSEHRAEAIHELVRMERDLLIAPALFRSRPIFAELSRLKCRLMLVETEE